MAACITVTGAFMTVYARNSFTVWSHTNPWDHGFSDVRVKQSFFSPEAFTLGKPTEFEMGKRRHRQSPYKTAYAQLYQRTQQTIDTVRISVTSGEYVSA